MRGRTWVNSLLVSRPKPPAAILLSIRNPRYLTEGFAGFTPRHPVFHNQLSNKPYLGTLLNCPSNDKSDPVVVSGLSRQSKWPTRLPKSEFRCIFHVLFHFNGHDNLIWSKMIFNKTFLWISSTPSSLSPPIHELLISKQLTPSFPCPPRWASSSPTMTPPVSITPASLPLPWFLQAAHVLPFPKGSLGPALEEEEAGPREEQEEERGEEEEKIEGDMP